MQRNSTHSDILPQSKRPCTPPAPAETALRKSSMQRTQHAPCMNSTSSEVPATGAEGDEQAFARRPSSTSRTRSSKGSRTDFEEPSMSEEHASANSDRLQILDSYLEMQDQGKSRKPQPCPPRKPRSESCRRRSAARWRSTYIFPPDEGLDDEKTTGEVMQTEPVHRGVSPLPSAELRGRGHAVSDRQSREISPFSSVQFSNGTQSLLEDRDVSPVSFHVRHWSQFESSQEKLDRYEFVMPESPSESISGGRHTATTGNDTANEGRALSSPEDEGTPEPEKALPSAPSGTREANRIPLPPDPDARAQDDVVMIPARPDPKAEFMSELFRDSVKLFDGEATYVEATVTIPDSQDWRQQTYTSRIAEICRICIVRKKEFLPQGGTTYATSIWTISSDFTNRVQQRLPEYDFLPYQSFFSEEKVTLTIPTTLHYHAPVWGRHTTHTALNTRLVNYYFANTADAGHFQSAILGKRLLETFQTDRTTLIHEGGLKNTFAYEEQLCGMERLRVWEDGGDRSPSAAGGVMALMHLSAAAGEGWIRWWINSSRAIKIKAKGATSVEIRGLDVYIAKPGSTRSHALPPGTKLAWANETSLTPLATPKGAHINGTTLPPPPDQAGGVSLSLIHI